MNLHVERAESEGVPVLRVSGELDVYTAPVLREALDAEPADGAVVVDLDGLDFIDSTGLGVLVATLKRVREAGGRLALVCTSATVLRPFSLTGLTEVFDFHAAVADATAAVGD